MDEDGEVLKGESILSGKGGTGKTTVAEFGGSDAGLLF